jgi:predicted Rossmann-fold nucleotide-binding protein
MPFPHLEGEDVPVNPFRTSLYSESELLGAFDPDDATSYTRTVDFEAYQNYVAHGRSTGAPYLHSIVRAIHDNSITQAIRHFADGRKIVGIMGGHQLDRTDPTYRQVVALAKQLSEAGLTVASGGGPGAMEATHVGAALAGADPADVDETLDVLSRAPSLPRGLGALVAGDGTVDTDLVAQLHRWQAPAFALARTLEPGAESLAIPTWHYGHEPPTPLASHIAKYFQNSIREDGLLALAKWGIVFAPGRAGTIQEIFQDAAQNYYRSYDWFSPMVLFGTSYWGDQIPVEAVLRALFNEQDEAWLTVTDDIDVAAKALVTFEPPDHAEPDL